MHIHACLPWLLRPRMKSTLSIMSIRAPGRPDGAVATRRKYLILMFLLAMLGGPDLHAREQSVVASPWPPYVDQKTLRRGLAVQLVTEALERAGYSTRVILTRWPRDLEGTKAGAYDVIASIWFTDQRAESIAFSKPYILTETRFVKRRDAPHQFNTPADLRGLRVGVVEGYAYGGAAPAPELGLTRVLRGSVLENLRSLVAGELDLVLADERVALYELNVNVPDGIRKTLILPKVYSSRGLRMGVSRQRPDHARIVQRFDAAVEAMKADGSYAAILGSHRVSAQ